MTETSYRRFGLLAFGIAATTPIVAILHGGVRALAISAIPIVLLTLGGIGLFHLARIHRDEISRLLTLLDGAAISGFTVAPIANELELWELWSISREMYGTENALSFEAYLAWWRSYPAGILGLFQNKALVGGLSIWPLRRSAFFDALKGRRMISHRGFCVAGEANRCRYWYVAGVVIKPGFRRRDALQYLFCEAMYHGLSTAREAMRLNICAAASSPEGARLLRRFGFTAVPAEPNAAPQLTAYALLNIGPKRLRTFADRFTALGARREGTA